MDLIIATRNKGKLREIKELFSDLPFHITSLNDYPQMPDIVEDGKTFRSNAIKKALTISRQTGKLVMGEDSGLEVSVLNNQPGVYSARFAGEGAGDKMNNVKLLQMLKGIPFAKRQARYRCVAALAKGDEVLAVASGTCPGFIIEQEKGTNGFGYDPLFFIPKYGKTFGELDSSIKARMSHRSRALKKMRGSIQSLLH